MRSKSGATVHETFPCFGIVTQFIQGGKKGQAVTKLHRISIMSENLEIWETVEFHTNVCIWGHRRGQVWMGIGS